MTFTQDERRAWQKAIEKVSKYPLRTTPREMFFREWWWTLEYAKGRRMCGRSLLGRVRHPRELGRGGRLCEFSLPCLYHGRPEMVRVSQGQQRTKE